MPTLHAPLFALHMRSTPHGEHVMPEHHAAWAQATHVLIGSQKAPSFAGSTAFTRHITLSMLWQAMQLHAAHEP